MTLRRATFPAALAAALLALSACGRDREVLPLAPAPGEASRVDLVPTDLKEHADFDALDRRILAAGGADELLRAYDDLARLAPDHARLLVRGALAALAADPEQRGPAVAKGVLQRLESTRAADPDVAWLWLRSRRLALAPAGRPLRAADDAAAARMAELAADARAFADAHPSWTGPFGARPDDARRLADEADLAVAGRVAARAAEAGEDAAAQPGAPAGAPATAPTPGAPAGAPAGTAPAPAPAPPAPPAEPAR